MPGAFGNLFVKGVILSPLHPLLGGRFAVIRFTGRRSGRQYATPINVIPLEAGLTAISQRDRTWWRNLRGGAVASLHRAGVTSTVRAEVIETPEAVEAGLAAYFRQVPGDARYFHIPLTPDGQPDPQALHAAAGSRVLIRFQPASSDPGRH